MCGIFGYTGPKLKDTDILTSLYRRGPDGKGIANLLLEQETNGSLTLLHTRLSIIDLSEKGSQPMTDDNNGNVIVFNGEIYNYLELRNELSSKGHSFVSNSDTEAILKGYAQWGIDVLKKLRGMFAFCIYDNTRKQIFIARDHFGMKPLYYFNENGRFCFSSTIKAIFKSGIKAKFQLDKTSLKNYLIYGCFIPPDSIIKEIKILPPGNYILYSNGEIHVKTYHSLNENICNWEGDRETAEKIVKEALYDSVEKHIIADVPVGVFLSSGIDSSVIAGIACSISKKKIHTFSIGFKNVKNIYDETYIAQKTAEKLGTTHHNIILDVKDFERDFEDFIESIDVPSVDGLNSYFISKAVKDHVKVVLSGLGGDELFAGYPVFKEIYNRRIVGRKMEIIRNLPFGILFRMGKQHFKTLKYSMFDVLCEKRILENFDDVYYDNLRKYYHEYNDQIKTISLFEINNYMSNMLLRDTDSVSLYNSLECRTPYVDIELFRKIINIPGNFKMDPKINKPLLVNTFNEYLLNEVYQSKKKGFNLPINEWLKKSSLIKDINKKNLNGLRYEIFNEEELKYFSHLTIGDSYKYLVLNMWMNQNIQYL